MTTDIIERAEAALKDEAVLLIAGPTYIRELVAELKAARAENERRKNPPRAAIRTWSACYLSDPPELRVPIGGTTYTLCPDDASVLHNILGEFLSDCADNARLREETNP